MTERNRLPFLPLYTLISILRFVPRLQGFGAPAEVMFSQLPQHRDESTETRKLCFWRKSCRSLASLHGGYYCTPPFFLREKHFKGSLSSSENIALSVLWANVSILQSLYLLYEDMSAWDIEYKIGLINPEGNKVEKRD